MLEGDRAMEEQHSQVNFRKLVSDLADMYSDHPFDVVITDLVANSLDAKARTIEIEWEDNRSVLVVTDDGDGMDSATFRWLRTYVTFRRYVDDINTIPEDLKWNSIVKNSKAAGQAISTGIPLDN